jgi:SAM-dependent methyltransferase
MNDVAHVGQIEIPVCNISNDPIVNRQRSSDWKNGYVAGVEYVHGVHCELSPSTMNLALLLQCVEPPEMQNGFTYCELGCGQGDSVNLFAACHPEGDFHGIDFNPAHIAGAKSLAAQVELGNVTFWEADLLELDELPLPAFDFIVMHGVYTWVAADVRLAIVEFIRKRLNPGGVVYVSYNSYSGWSAHAPLRELLCSYADTQTGTLLQRIESALEFVKRFKTGNAAFFGANSSTWDFFEYISTLPRNYLAHEFFNRDWILFNHAGLVDELAQARLRFVGSAKFAENQDMLMFSDEQQAMFSDIKDSIMRESIKNFIRNPLLRRDLFIQGNVTINPASQLELFLGRRFALVMSLGKQEPKAMFPIGEVVFDRELYDPILMAFKLKPHTAAELLRRPEIALLDGRRVMEALIILISAEYLMPAVEPTPLSINMTRRLNHTLLERWGSNPEQQFLASPVLQNAIKVDWLDRLFILCESRGNHDPISYVLEQLDKADFDAGRSSREEIMAELPVRFDLFRMHQRPLLQQLGIL